MKIKHAVVRQLEGITFAARSDTYHWTVMDGPSEFGGNDAASRPNELVLFALGGCTASDIVPILKKKRVQIDSMEVRLTASVAEEHPHVFTDIHIEYVFFGRDIDRAAIERAIELSLTKYCTVSAMLRNSVKITHSYKVEESAAKAAAAQLAPVL
jgi:putative redox protein